jgi:GH15 family glucan-1,4-alpha-glucosidase
LEQGDEPAEDYWEFICDVADAVLRRWRMPDQGIWELRPPPQSFVSSKVMCWAALDRAVRIAERFHPNTDHLERWASERDVIRGEVLSKGLSKGLNHGTSAFQSYEVDMADAALLLIPSVGFVEWDHELNSGTIGAVRSQLEIGPGLVLRYRTADGLAGREGAFVACAFWLVEALARNGKAVYARTAFDAACATGNDLRLFSEEVDPSSGLFLGNFPQRLSHLSHIHAALALRAAVSGESGSGDGWFEG